MSPQKNTMAVLGQIVKLIPAKLIEKLKNDHKIQARSFSATKESGLITRLPRNLLS